MKKSFELDLEIRCTKIANCYKQVDEIQLKSEHLKEQLDSIKKSISDQLKDIESLGQKTIRVDGKPDTPKDLEFKREANLQIYKDKLELVRKICIQKGVWDRIESLLPTVYHDANLDKQ